MKFSERIGKSQIKDIIQIDSIDDDLKNGLWNAVTICYWDKMLNDDYLNSKSKDTSMFVKRIWINFFKNTIDSIPNHTQQIKKFFKTFFFEAEWFEIYDFVEFLPNNYLPERLDNINEGFEQFCNHTLEKELSGFRFVNGILVQISNDEEIKSINESLLNTDKLTTVNSHLIRSLELFSDRKSPDYRNSIKESISSVEAYCTILTGDSKATLGQTLKKLQNSINIHPALQKAFSHLYGYTSEADGIRHALLEDHNLQQEDAKFMLVSCSAFINYLIEKQNKSKS